MNKKYEIIIVGAGLSGLTLANQLLINGIEKEDLLVLEASERTGGLIKTTEEKGYTTEWGPEGLRGGKSGTDKIFSFIDTKPMEIPNTVPARYIVHKGKLRRVPHGIISALSTPLVPFFGKIRLIFEIFVKKKEEDETLEDFIKRRFGKGIYPVIDAVVSGIYGGSPSSLSTKYAFPYLKEFEKSGSVIKGSIKYMKMLKKQKSSEPKEKSPFLVKPEGGMKSIIEGLEKNPEIVLNMKVDAVDRQEDIYKIKCGNIEYVSKILVLANGVNGIQHMNVLDMKKFDKVPVSVVSIVSLGFRSIDIPDEYHGYGFLSPSEEDTFVLGVLFTSKLFPNTAPEGETLFRVYVGGINHPERAVMDDKELIENVLIDLKKLMRIDVKPVYSSIQKQAPNGIPQIMLKHNKLIEWKEKVEKSDNLYLSGIGWNSIACDSLILEAVNIANKICNK